MGRHTDLNVGSNLPVDATVNVEVEPGFITKLLTELEKAESLAFNWDNQNALPIRPDSSLYIRDVICQLDFTNLTLEMFGLDTTGVPMIQISSMASRRMVRLAIPCFGTVLWATIDTSRQKRTGRLDIFEHADSEFQKLQQLLNETQSSLILPSQF